MYFDLLFKRLISASIIQCRTRYNFATSLHPRTTMASFVDKQLHLLEIEHLSEIEERNFETSNLSIKVLQRKGICIPKLIINSLETGLYNRTIATFSLRTVNKTFPFNILSSGDIVKLNHPEVQKVNGDEYNGVVTKISDQNVSVAFDSLAYRDTLDSLNQHGNSVALIKVANKVTYERLKHALKNLSVYSSGPAEYLIDVLFGNATPASTAKFDVTFHNSDLNSCQREAVSFALTQRELAIIHGPPGTGKTTTVIEIIAQLVKSGQKVLACAPSNVAVDNLLEKLSCLKISTMARGFNSKSSSRKLNLVRLGHPARILDPQLQQLSLDALIYHSGAGSVIRDVRKDIDNIHAKLGRCSNKAQERLLYQERRNLMAELRKREKKATFEILSPADVVLATNVGAYSHGPLQNLKLDHFDAIVIDECGQALEAACWIPLLRARKCILAGDHLQLSPTIISNEAANEGLSLTLLERLIGLHGDKVVRMLTEQYRMHDVIMQWSSNQMYDGRLTAHQSVASHLLCDLYGVEDNEDTRQPFILIDTAGCEMTESESEESDSKANEGEVKIVYSHVMNLINAGVHAEDIAIISPYNLQVDVLRTIFHDQFPKLEVKSVDGFQGREKEAVVISLVRSNDENEVGFLSDNRRLNVAVTRARRHVAVICDSDTVSKDKFIKSLVTYVESHGEVRTGFEYLHDDDFDNETVARVIHSFHLIAPSPNPPKPVTKNETSLAKSNKKEKKSRDQPSVVDEELKNMYRDILKKYRKLFLSGDAENEVGSDMSGALDIEVDERKRKIVFPGSLTSQERKAVHELCDQMKIIHRSVGEGKNRKVYVIFEEKTSNVSQQVAVEKELESNLKESPTFKRTEKTDVCLLESVVDDVTSSGTSELTDHDSIKTEEDSGSEMKVAPQEGSSNQSAVDEIESDFIVCEKCGKKLPKENLTLHLLHCERLMKLKNKMKDEAKNKEMKKNKKSNIKQKNLKSRSEAKVFEQGDDFDNVINDAISSNRTCFHGKCDAKVSTVGQLCKMCKRTYCMRHHLPEVHGCGDHARKNARKQIIRDGILYPGSGTPSRKPPPDKRAVMKYRLNAKLKTLEESRKPNKSKNSSAT